MCDLPRQLPRSGRVTAPHLRVLFHSKKGGQYHEKTDDPQSGNVEDHERFLHPWMWSSCVKTIRRRWGAPLVMAVSQHYDS
jgi:hypothetical protein